MIGAPTLTNTQKRLLPEVTALNVLMCLLVVFVHVSAEPVTAFTEGRTIWGIVFIPARLATINMRGFVFLSGLKLFISRKSHINYGSFYLKRFTRVIIPYVIINIIYYVYFVQHDYFSFNSVDLLGYIATGSLVAPFYFVILIIQFYALTPVWRTMVKRINPVLYLIPTAVLTLFFSQYMPDIIKLVSPGTTFIYNDRLFTSYLFFWLAGCAVGANYDAVKKLITEHTGFIVAQFVFFAAAEGLLPFLSFSGMRQIDWLEPVHYLYCISTILCLYTLFTRWFETRPLQNRLVLGIDKAAYEIFLVHSLVIFYVNDWLYTLGIGHLSVKYLLRLLIVYPVSIGVCLLWHWLKKKVKKRTKTVAT